MAYCRCDRQAENVYSSVSPDSTLAFVGDPCSPTFWSHTFEFICITCMIFFIMVPLYTLLTPPFNTYICTRKEITCLGRVNIVCLPYKFVESPISRSGEGNSQTQCRTHQIAFNLMEVFTGKLDHYNDRKIFEISFCFKFDFDRLN
jgi:hypothetical protein